MQPCLRLSVLGLDYIEGSVPVELMKRNSEFEGLLDLDFLDKANVVPLDQKAQVQPNT